jgi:hypothetical protein
MPAKNLIRHYDIPAFYHVYNRGAGKQAIFHDDADREKFLSLFSRYLDPDEDSVRADGLPYDKYELDVVAYCLMDNHFHLLLYQEVEVSAISQFMKSLSTAYTMYYNMKYEASGHLFQGTFKASRITSDVYLSHITRYIHMNPRSYLRYKWSSVRAYLGGEAPEWLSPDRASDMNPREYEQFLQGYEGKKACE